ncbi:NAD(P)/FAD-dependent oxidoreductase [Lonepinella sp. MS14437]|uniref:NAD(P)/FAD-dependent oxidoreductase n=1 Tax=Lonepinella sp. MS14437 TaxID=3003620 RepID=UPI0036D8E607
MNNHHQTIIIGAGAAGLFCASLIGKCGQNVMILDSGKKIGRKILMSGGGFCNFTNLDVRPSHYLSQNPHFVKSALARFTQWDFIALVVERGIAYHEKNDGQLFCDNSAQDIVDLLEDRCKKAKVNIQLRQQIDSVEPIENDPNVRFNVRANGVDWTCQNLVIATGGLSMPALGASPFGYKIAEQFAIPVIPPRASLVPFTYLENDKIFTALSGISLDVNVSVGNQAFRGDMLFTHRGLSGPAILQISNYWQPNASIRIDLLPNQSIVDFITELKATSPNMLLKTALSQLLPKRLIDLWIEYQRLAIGNKALAQLSKVDFNVLSELIHQWQFQPNGTEGYRTAEVTLGGVDTQFISSKTMQANHVQGLYFIGEVLDVTGWLGGYNFQWAWSSAYACACAIAESEI